ncbi:hypothetical protein EVAR_34258_1 [Eumeta japonica]|uniref:Retrotransposon gag domain-containing protein n=1 Tax=Eumeta variegata TaxID=151549 RepID=A0A4C1VYD1_EUMVA|nr:hypothetical protein EVAR_34258_1 [Eumeta japonica]
MTEDTLKSYCDEDGNMIFQDQFLGEITQEESVIPNGRNLDDSIVKILKKLIKTQQNKEKQSMKKISATFVIEKFDGKNMNAYNWMETFEKECARFDIVEEEKIDIFRLFLEKSCIDWYSSMMIKHGLQSEWSEWKSSFLQTYANENWTTSKYALFFKYQTGSLLEYAIKREKLLLEVRKTIDQGTLIDIIAAGLPDFITDRINKEEIVQTKDLFNELGKLKHLVAKKKFSKEKKSAVFVKIYKKVCAIIQKIPAGSKQK